MKSLFLWVLIFAAFALVGALDGPELHSFEPYIRQQKKHEPWLIEQPVNLVEKAVENPAVAVDYPSPTFWR